MPYVARDDQGCICGVSHSSREGFTEWQEVDEPELLQFWAQIAPAPQALSESDLGFVRVIEDVIELLIAKQVIRFTDLPVPAQQKMLDRQHLRESLGGRLDLLEEESSLW